MKKILFLNAVILLCFMMPDHLLAQYQFDKRYSQWSVELKSGINYIHMSTDNNASFYSNRIAYYFDKMGWETGVRFRYEIDKKTEFGMEAAYNDYSQLKLKGSMPDITLYYFLNLSQLFYDYKPWNDLPTWSWYIFGGAGLGNYSYDRYEMQLQDNGIAPFVTGGVDLEYHINSQWSLIGEGQYRLYFSTMIGGIDYGRYIDAPFATLGVRYKFLMKEKCHNCHRIGISKE